MIVPGSANPLLLASAAAAGGLQVSRSLRFDGGAYLNRTPASAGNRRTWTWAGWVKRSSFGNSGNQATRCCLFSAYINGSDYIFVTYGFSLADTLAIQYGGGNIDTAAVYRDPSAWMHVVFAVDTTQSTAGDRLKIYVNNVLQAISGATISQNYDLPINASGTVHTLGSGYYTAPTLFFNGYLANIHFIDGQALTPASFAETDATTGQWIPKAYSGSYGTNGFYLEFADNSSNTATTLGKDTSGNSNNWTPNNLSVTAGAGNDSLVDSPTNYGTDTGVGGEVRGNYATLNPLNTHTSITVSNGNLDYVHSSSGGITVGTIGVSSGKYYWEHISGTAYALIGLYQSGARDMGYIGTSGVSLGFTSTGFATASGGPTVVNSISFTTSDVIGLALNMDAGTLTIYKNGTASSLVFSGLTGTWSPAEGANSTSSGVFNFGQRAFAYPLSTYKSLCTQNLPEGTITTSGTYTGNGVADGPFVYLNGVPTAMTVGINAVTFGTDADKLSNGFKLQTTNVLYNQNALSYSYSITTTGAKFKYARAQPNP